MANGIFDDILANVGETPKFSKGFTYGTHEVLIGTAEAKTKDTKKMKDAPIIEVVVFDEQDSDKTATCTLWFHSEGGAKMGVAKVLGILVHNVGEEKKEAVRELGKKLFGGINDIEKSREIAVRLINDKLIGKKAYLVAEPHGKYPTTSYGDLWHYPAKPQGEPELILNSEDVTEELAGDIPEFEDL